MNNTKSQIPILRYCQNLARRIIVLARNKHAANWLYFLTCLESIIFPIPTDPLLAAVVATRKKQWFKIALFTTISSVVGGIVGYLIGEFLVGNLLDYIVNLIGQTEKYTKAKTALIAQGAVWIFIAGFSPFPYKIITIGAGAAGISLPLFIIISLISRGLRYFLVAIIMYWLGPHGRYWIQKRFGTLTIVLTLVILLLIYGYFAFVHQ